MRTKLAIKAALVIMAAASVGIVQTAIAKGTPYQAGYDHGCDDAKISNVDARYVNQPDKGPSQHTAEFIRGYHADFTTCLGHVDAPGAVTSSSSSSSSDGN